MQPETHRQNNFNLIRIVLSLSVLFFHTSELSGLPQLAILGKIFDGEAAVQAFFIISGFFMLQSYERSKSAREFFGKRIRRVYPAYITVIFLCAICGCFVTEFSAREYFSDPGLYKYLAANAVFLNFIQPELPGVFANNLFKAVNGSLWTLKIEVAFYLIVPLIFLLRRKINPHLLYFSLFILSAVYFIGMTAWYKSTGQDSILFLSRQLPGQLFYFILGAWVAEIVTKEWFRLLLKFAGIPALIALYFNLGLVADSIIMMISVFYVGLLFPLIRYPFRREDPSFGLYIYHFPVIQILVELGIFSVSPLAGVILSVFISATLAALSWAFIERPFIHKKAAVAITG